MNYLRKGSVQYHLGKQHYSRWPHIIMVVLLAILVVGITIFWFQRDKAAAPASTTQPTENQLAQTTTEKPTETNLVHQFNAKKLQTIVTNWVKSHSGTYSVVIVDPATEKTLAKHQPDKPYFAASIYKLYVAYEGYRKVDDGTYSFNQPYLNGWTRKKCLDQMIRISHSPCAEKMWVELGKENLNKRMASYGLTNTSMIGITTTAADAAKILVRLQKGEGLSEASHKLYLDSMKGQIYRDALPKGFTKATVYDKVGFRETVEYHDVAIVRFNDRGTLIVSVLTQNAGTKNIAGLASAIQSAVY